MNRLVPLHAVLANWELGRFVRYAARAPSPDDHVVPQAEGSMLSRHRVRKGLILDVEAVGLRHRRVQDMRSTFITLECAD